MNSEQARIYFVDNGLKYEDVTEGDICVLTMLLNKHVKNAIKKNKNTIDTMRMSQKIKSKYTTKGTLKCCFLFVNSDYFTQREAISFNQDGFIGFAGWASSDNVKPMIDAFVEWVDYLRDHFKEFR
ncbi:MULTISPECIES: hypothetical protein [Bacillus]|uniref:Uncharacterized protein n=1 Tax=Bacillus glycinifermentans TaxID=1664069 RepID=A0AAJ3YY52_9BACI|nr:MULTISPECIES: hypothetical protein [Bacillus]MDU0069882.1 hypothetical protein [Bacillus sp. IG6]MED8020942.1 hypothetical protein [Bacillus glycinifermentans]QAT65286.1 hypothetical protein EQZ20_10355 [Bacillus glycinifermentans]